MALPQAHELIRFVHTTVTGLDERFARARMWSPRPVFLAVLLLTRARRRTSYREMLSTFLTDTAAFLTTDIGIAHIIHQDDQNIGSKRLLRLFSNREDCSSIKTNNR